VADTLRPYHFRALTVLSWHGALLWGGLRHSC